MHAHSHSPLSSLITLLIIDTHLQRPLYRPCNINRPSIPRGIAPIVAQTQIDWQTEHRSDNRHLQLSPLSHATSHAHGFHRVRRQFSISSSTMRIFSSAYEFDYSWEEVSTNNWRKYCPWNDKAEHVLAVDTLSRNIDQATGILRTERLITCRQNAPQWILSILGGDTTSQVYEVSYVDPQSKKVTMCSTNMTWSNLLQCRETVIYQPSANAGSKKTEFVQQAKIIAFCGGWQKIRNKIEESCVERFRENATKGREGFEMVLEMSRQVFGEEKERLRQGLPVTV